MATAKKAAPKTEERASLTDIKEELVEEAVQEEKEAGTFFHDIIGSTRKIKNNVNTKLIRQSKKAEKWHKDLASWPLKKVARVNRLEPVAADVDAVQTKTIKHAYTILRTVIKSIDDIAEEILTRTQKRLVKA